jgi:hypothetical protein
LGYQRTRITCSLKRQVRFSLPEKLHFDLKFILPLFILRLLKTYESPR